MGTAPATKSVLRFGVFELDAATGELRKKGILLKLHPQPAKVLILLARHPSELVTREQIKEALWGEETFVDFEQGLNSCVRQIRSVLTDDPDNPRFIQTIPRMGYRFILPVTSADAASVMAKTVLQVPPAPGAKPVTTRYLLFAALAIIVIVVLATGLFLLRRRMTLGGASAGKIMLVVLPFENYSAQSEQDYLADGLTEELITQLGS